MKRSFGVICILLGLGMLLGALLLYLHNEQEEQQVQQSVELYLPQIKDAIAEHMEEQVMIQESLQSETDQTESPELPQSEQSAEAVIPIDPDYYSTEMTVEIFDGYGFVGYLTIPSLNLELPVLSELDDELLKLSPCRFYGSTKTDDLVIGAHNYTRLFAKIWRLHVGDEVQFTDMDGKIWYYRLAEKLTLKATDGQILNNGEYPLTLFTCTYVGADRVTLRFDLIKE